MIFLRFNYEGKNGNAVLEDGIVKEISGSFFEKLEYTGKEYKIEDIQLLVPCLPSKVVAVGLNYSDHIKEMNLEMPKNPVLFIKLPHTIIGPEETILIPANATRVDYEAELAVVIKKACYKIKPEEVNEYLLGATCLNDVTERDMQNLDGQWTRAKNFETFCPVGPYIVSDLEYNSLDISLTLNSELKQKSNTSNLLWNVQELVSFISNVIPLNPGDIVTTGTTFGVGPMADGDLVEVAIDKIGTLRNYVKKY